MCLYHIIQFEYWVKIRQTLLKHDYQLHRNNKLRISFNLYRQNLSIFSKYLSLFEDILILVIEFRYGYTSLG